MVAESSVSKADRMDVHENPRLTPHSRAEPVRRVIDEGQTVGKWVEEMSGALALVKKRLHYKMLGLCRFPCKLRP